MMICKNESCKSINPQPEENFPIEKEGGYSWRRGTCKSCRSQRLRDARRGKREEYNAYMRQYNAEHKDSKKWKDWHRNKHLKKTYGMTLDQYAQMLSSQNGHCYLCPKKFSGKGKPLNVDHNHTTGKVRGLLCDSCNRAISILDDPALFSLAIAYIGK